MGQKEVERVKRQTSYEAVLSIDSPCNDKQGVPVLVTQCSMIPIISLSLEEDIFCFILTDTSFI